MYKKVLLSFVVCFFFLTQSPVWAQNQKKGTRTSKSLAAVYNSPANRDGRNPSQNRPATVKGTREIKPSATRSPDDGNNGFGFSANDPPEKEGNDDFSSPYFSLFNRNDVPWVQLYPNVRSKTFRSDDRTVNLYEIKKNSGLNGSTASFEFPKRIQPSIGFIIQGGGMVRINNMDKNIDYGSVFFTSPKEKVSLFLSSPVAYVVEVVHQENPLISPMQGNPEAVPSDPIALSENAIKKFIFTWFDQLDRRGDINFFMEKLTGSVHKNTWQEPNLNSREDFQKWYTQKMKGRIQSNNFKIDQIKIEPQADGSANVRFDLNWNALRKDGVVVEGTYQENWVLYIDSTDNHIKIRDYTVVQAR